MIQLTEEEFFLCYECDAEFSVNAESEDALVSFCPYCGSELELDEQDDDDDDEEDDDLEDEEY